MLNLMLTFPSQIDCSKVELVTTPPNTPLGVDTKVDGVNFSLRQFRGQSMRGPMLMVCKEDGTITDTCMVEIDKEGKLKLCKMVVVEEPK